MYTYWSKDKVRMLEPCMTVIECGLHRYEVVCTSVCLGRRV